MNKEVKAKWLKALRSGKYKQGDSYLRRKDGTYCCLGVLCDIYKKETGEGHWDGSRFNVGSYGNSEIPPSKVAEWAGLEDSNPKVSVPKKGSFGLTFLNDGDEDEKIKKHSFKEIANIIEKKL